jgi:hypothetical protein
VVAQEVQRVIPEATTKNSKGYPLVDNDPTIWSMVNAIKEQQALILRQQKQFIIIAMKKALCTKVPSQPSQDERLRLLSGRLLC